MMPNYSRPSFSPCDTKPARGSRVLAKEEIDAKAVQHEREVKTQVRKRDPRCRWPEVHKCRFALEAVHIQDASLGGVMEPENLVRLCGWLHRRGPESIHGKQLKIEKNTSAGANGGLTFYRQHLDGSYYVVAREVRQYEIERD